MKHPTFALVLHNHMMRTALQGQGRFSLNTSDMDPNTTIEELREALKNGKDDKTAKLLEDLQKRTQVFSGNVTGTDAYWRSTYQEFMAKILYDEYMLGEEMSFFHTVRAQSRLSVVVLCHPFVVSNESNVYTGFACRIS